MRAAVAGALAGTSTKVQTARQADPFDFKGLESFVKFIKFFLLAFAGVTLFVGAFIIFNTFSITVAQRTREFALLRTIGASRRQVLRSVVLEALVIGLAATIAGAALGVGIAKLLNAVMNMVQIDLPQAGTVFALRTVLVCLLVGVAVTVVAGLIPAVRATRVPPVAVLREGATMPVHTALAGDAVRRARRDPRRVRVARLRHVLARWRRCRPRAVGGRGNAGDVRRTGVARTSSRVARSPGRWALPLRASPALPVASPARTRPETRAVRR